MHPCVETMMGLFGGPNLLNEGHFNPVPGMLLVEKRRRARRNARAYRDADAG